MARTKPMYDYKPSMGWRHTLEGGPYDGLSIRVLDADPEITFHNGLVVYRRELWLDDDGRPMQVKAKRAKRDGGDFDAPGYRYVWSDTETVFTKHIVLTATGNGRTVPLFEQTITWADGRRSVEEWRADELRQRD